MRGGQVSIEYLLITGFSLVILIPLVIIFYTQSAAIETDFTEAQGRTLARELVESAERVYYSGPPTKEQVKVTFPSNVNHLDITNNSIVLNIASNTGNAYDLLVPSTVPLIPGNLTSSEGPVRLLVMAEQNGVRIAEP